MFALFSYKTTITGLEIGFENVQQKHVDKIIFDQEIVHTVPIYSI